MSMIQLMQSHLSSHPSQDDAQTHAVQIPDYTFVRKHTTNKRRADKRRVRRWS